jgi:acyl carrier protein
MENLKEELKGIIAEVIEEEDFNETDDFIKDLGVDSMMALEIIAQVEKKYRVTIKEEEMTRISSLEQVYELVVQLLAEQGKGEATNV